MLNLLLIISITCEKDTAHKLLAKRLALFGQDFSCETYKKTITRCYNCQKFGHIAKYCRGICYCHCHEKKSSSNQKLQQRTSLQQL